MGKAIPPSQMASLIALAAIVTTGPLLTSVALLWESGLLEGTAARLISKLLESQQLGLVSEFTTLDGFINSNRSLYRHDQARYPMYFRDPSGVYLQAGPTKTKPRSTTLAIDSQLKDLLGRRADNIRTLPNDDVFVVIENLSVLESAVRNRDGRAYTMSLFQEATRRMEVSEAFGRMLSQLHIREYLDFLGAEIISGIPGLEAFDPVSEAFPRYDFRYSWLVLSALGITPAQIVEAVGFLIMQRSGDDHGHLTSEIALLNNVLHALTVPVMRHPAAGVRSLLESRDDNWSHMVATLRASLIDWQYPVDPHDLFRVAASRASMLANSLEMRSAEAARLIERYRTMSTQSTTRTLLLVASETEQQVAIEALRATSGRDTPTPQFLAYHTVFDFGLIGGTQVLLARSAQGVTNPASMPLTAVDVIDQVHPDYAICVGIGYGLRQDEQHLGDVMVATQVRMLDHWKIQNSRTIDRGDVPSTSVTLQDRLQTAGLQSLPSKVHFGPMLSVNVLVDDERFVADLKNHYPDAIGGEMEGAGVYSASSKRRCEWIMVKGISDWGFNKDDRSRALAARNAVGFVGVALGQGGLSQPPGVPASRPPETR
jgi:nucleoside phosphorylase